VLERLSHHSQEKEAGNLPCVQEQQFDIARAFVTLSSRGPGHRPFTAVTRVRIPLGSQPIFIGESSFF
jgi:hypothetical protein